MVTVEELPVDKFLFSFFPLNEAECCGASSHAAVLTLLHINHLVGAESEVEFLKFPVDVSSL